MEFNKNRVNLPNGEEYYYLEEGRGNNVLILVHGNMSSSVHFMPLIKSLPENIRVIAPDLRGFGDSSYNNKFSTLRELAEDLKLFMDELGVKKAHLAGWSTGGGIVLEFASMYQDMTESLILIEAASHKGYPIFKKDGNFAPMAGTKTDPPPH